MTELLSYNGSHEEFVWILVSWFGLQLLMISFLLMIASALPQNHALMKVSCPGAQIH